jgi:hypothetical protein
MDGGRGAVDGGEVRTDSTSEAWRCGAAVAGGCGSKNDLGGKRSLDG